MVDRGDGDAQVGAGPNALVLRGTGAALLRLLGTLDGTRSLAQLEQEHVGAGEAVTLLAVHGLLTAPAPPLPPVLLLGAGRLGRACATALAAAGVPLLLCDPDPPLPGLYPGPPQPTAAAALRLLLQSGGARGGRHPGPGPVLGMVAHWSESTVRPTLAVLAQDRCEPDRGITDTLLRRDVAHLLVRPLDGGALVGPLVLPGRSCCTRCTDLYRASRDPAWPQVLAQLIRRRGGLDPAAARWAAATALPSVLAALRGTEPDLVDHTCELRVPRWTSRLRRWPAHPDCGCDLARLGA
ncbi:hypothetical protein SAMN04489747_2677 [Auraticoccus monumenti]|uniref:Bacteriocin biosynthesis cyclodehydratase domain-containing protein n=1 Tax=Auraticoccus monumenti TaxID=675864 RepID=A0A1G7AMT6_9ACTN|nr:hypothetical protein SAMN04489747_2677 [Auraticoccus monumenti]